MPLPVMIVPEKTWILLLCGMFNNTPDVWMILMVYSEIMLQSHLLAFLQSYVFLLLCIMTIPQYLLNDPITGPSPQVENPGMRYLVFQSLVYGRKIIGPSIHPWGMPIHG